VKQYILSINPMTNVNMCLCKTQNIVFTNNTKLTCIIRTQVSNIQI